MSKGQRNGLPLDLWRAVNRAAYARSQATFAQQRARLAAEALAMLRDGAGLESVRAHLDAVERGAA